MLTPIVTNVDATQNEFIVDGTITPTLNYGTAGGLLPHGDTLSFAALDKVLSNRVPNRVDVWAEYPQGAAMLFDWYKYVPGTTKANGVLQIGVVGTEFTPGAAYSGAAPTNIVGFVLKFRAWFPSFL